LKADRLGWLTDKKVGGRTSLGRKRGKWGKEERG